MNPGHFDASPADPSPEFHPIEKLRNLSRIDGTPIDFDIVGVHAKGFMVMDGEWTCYRRNYFSCTASYTLSPLPPQGTTVQLLDHSGRMRSVSAIAIGLSAVLHGEGRAVQLVKYTAKRDRASAVAPEKVRLEPRPEHMQVDSVWAHMVQHTFGRLQFKYATPNNGRRPAPQKYYHLEVELWVDVGKDQQQEWIKIGYKQSARLIVRGRSPGHYNSQEYNNAMVSQGRREPRSDGAVSTDFVLDESGMFSPTYTGYDARAGARHSHNQSGLQPPYPSGSYQH